MPRQLHAIPAPNKVGFRRRLRSALSLSLSRTLIVWLVSVLVPDGPVIIGIDDTLERRTGRRLSARGIYRDPVRSSRGHFVKASGLRWQAFMLLAPLSWTGRVWGLPFLTVLCPSERYAHERGTSHRKLTDRARQGLLQVVRWLPGRRIIAVTDSSYSRISCHILRSDGIGGIAA
ncbi:transposase [Gluconacetobacter sp. Hr-1-5]|uniref:transposase n=1 Tax=Gluconacetobacter sp. Hr-1-5 TaxID=3395370 RepID=UPI003B522B4B